MQLDSNDGAVERGLIRRVVASDDHAAFARLVRMHQSPVRQFETGYCAGNTDRKNAVMVRVITDIAVFVEVHGLGSGKRRFLADIECSRLTVDTVINEEAAPTDVSSGRPGDGHCKCSCDSGVDSIAALFQDFDANLGRDCR